VVSPSLCKWQGPPSKATAALSFFREVQEECLKLGIPLTTRHRGELTARACAHLVSRSILTEIYLCHARSCHAIEDGNAWAEVAPGQYEMAPFFGPVQTQIDQNLMVMQILEEVAARNGLACLLQEKPFAGINGSGKHNNWSISTSDGTQLLVPKVSQNG
jgi:glutamine synthetase